MVATSTYPLGDSVACGLVKTEAVIEVRRRQDGGYIDLPSWWQCCLWPCQNWSCHWSKKKTGWWLAQHRHPHPLLSASTMMTMHQIASTPIPTQFCTRYGDNNYYIRYHPHPHTHHSVHAMVTIYQISSTSTILYQISSTSTIMCTLWWQCIRYHPHRHHYVHAMMTIYQISSTSTHTPFCTRYGDNVSDIIHILTYTILYMLWW